MVDINVPLINLLQMGVKYVISKKKKTTTKEKETKFYDFTI